MNKKTHKALKGSIRKWEDIVKGEGSDNGIENCPLCEMLYFNIECDGCPVKEKTGMDYCYGSPYDEWIKHHKERHTISYPLKIECEKCKEIAIKELEFLKSLLEERGR